MDSSARARPSPLVGIAPDAVVFIILWSVFCLFLSTLALVLRFWAPQYPKGRLHVERRVGSRRPCLQYRDRHHGHRSRAPRGIRCTSVAAPGPAAADSAQFERSDPVPAFPGRHESVSPAVDSSPVYDAFSALALSVAPLKSSW
jgi:hypothetical protein